MSENVTITVERHIRASAERVFDAWLDPAMIAKWFSPELGPFVRIDVDAQVGGRFSIAQDRSEASTEDVGAGVVDHVGEYLVLDRPTHLRFTFGIGSLDGSESVVDIRISPTEEGCLLTLSTDLPAEWAHYAERTKEGWSKVIGNLDSVLHDCIWEECDVCTGFSTIAIVPKFVALLRGINVGGKNLVPMAELRALGTEIGCENVQTLLQSGNVVFESLEKPNAELESKWAEAVLNRFGLKIDMVVRSAEEWKEAIEANPFPLEEGLNLSHFFAYFLESKPEPEAIVAVLAFDRGPEKPCIFGKTLYCYFPDTVIDSKFTGAWIEKTLGVRATARNWNTVLKIAALLKG